MKCISCPLVYVYVYVYVYLFVFVVVFSTLFTLTHAQSSSVITNKPLYSFGASYAFEGAKEWVPPTFGVYSNSTNCNLDSSILLTYFAFNYTFNTHGVRHITAVWDYNQVNVYLYTHSFDINNKCDNMLFLYSESVDLSLYDFYAHFYFEANVNYIFVFSMYGAQTLAVDLWEGFTLGSISNEQMYYFPYPIDGDCFIYPYSKTPYTNIPFNVSTSGYYDLNVLFSYPIGYQPNPTGESIETNLALYQGVPNATIQSNACNGEMLGDGVQLLDYNYFYSYFGNFLDVYLESNTTYTLVFSVITSFTTDYNVLITSSSAVHFNKGGFNFPVQNETCVESITNQDWAAFNYNILQNSGIVIYIQSNNGEGIFLYEGSNLGNETTSPYTCPIAFIQLFTSTDPQYYFIETNRLPISWTNFTVVISSNSNTTYLFFGGSPLLSPTYIADIYPSNKTIDIEVTATVSGSLGVTSTTTTTTTTGGRKIVTTASGSASETGGHSSSSSHSSTTTLNGDDENEGQSQSNKSNTAVIYVLAVLVLLLLIVIVVILLVFKKKIKKLKEAGKSERNRLVVSTQDIKVVSEKENKEDKVADGV